MERKVGHDVKPRLIDAQNRVALPADVLQHLGVKPGDYVALTIDDGEVRIRKVRWEVDE